MGFYHPEDWPNTSLLGGTQLKTSANSYFLTSAFLQEVREIILRARRLGMVYGRPGTSSKVHCMGRGFMADRIRGRSQSCRRIGLIGLCMFHTIEVPYLINVET